MEVSHRLTMFSAAVLESYMLYTLYRCTVSSADSSAQLKPYQTLLHWVGLVLLHGLYEAVSTDCIYCTTLCTIVQCTLYCVQLYSRFLLNRK